MNQTMTTTMPVPSCPPRPLFLHQLAVLFVCGATALAATGQTPPPSPARSARDVLHNPRESVVVRIGTGRKASFCSQ